MSFFPIPTVSGGPGQLTVNTKDLGGNTLLGFYTVLSQGGIGVATGFTPASFTVTGGQTYVVALQNFGSCHFASWTDTGSTSAQRTFTAAGGAQTFTAAYDCGTTTTTTTTAPGGASTINISATNSAGAQISGYYTTLWLNGVMIQSCFFPCSFTVNNGQVYQVAVSDFGPEAFSHWSDGTTSRFHTVNVPGVTTAINLIAIYRP
jgi:hypothetical protein